MEETWGALQKSPPAYKSYKTQNYRKNVKLTSVNPKEKTLFGAACKLKPHREMEMQILTV